MKYKTIAETNENENYIGRIVSRETLNPISFLTKTIDLYFLEIQNRETGKIKREKIGRSNVIKKNGNQQLFFDILIKSINFTEKGLEAVIRHTTEGSGFLYSRPTIYGGYLVSIPKIKFPN